MENQTPKMTTTFQIEKELHTQFKMVCVQQNKSMSDIMNELITKYIKSHGKK